jgi:hypothetical protein
MGDDLTTDRPGAVHTHRNDRARSRLDRIRKNNGLINLNAFFTGKTVAWQGLIAVGNFLSEQIKQLLTTVI